MPRGGLREGAGRKKVAPPTKLEALKAFNALPEKTQMLRPEEILLRAANALPSPDGDPWTQTELDAAKALLPYSIAKPATVAIHQVTRTDVRQMTDDELERIINRRGSGSSGVFASTESPLLTVDVVRSSPGADGLQAG